MIAVNKNPDLQQVFSEMLLIGSIFAPSGKENDQQHLREILARCGVTLVRSECTILERNTIGDSVITIARYSLEYRNTADTHGENMFIEGELTMQVDNRGRMNMSITAKPTVSPPPLRPGNAKGSMERRKMPSIPFLSSHFG